MYIKIEMDYSFPNFPSKSKGIFNITPFRIE